MNAIQSNSLNPEVDLEPLRAIDDLLLLVMDQDLFILWLSDSMRKLLDQSSSIEARCFLDILEKDCHEEFLQGVQLISDSNRSQLMTCLIKGSGHLPIHAKCRLVNKSGTYYMWIEWEQVERLMTSDTGSQPRESDTGSDPREYEKLNLTQMEENLFFLLREYLGQPLNKDTIHQHLYLDVVVHPKTVNSHIYNLRKKLKGSGFAIDTIGKGKWRLVSIE